MKFQPGDLVLTTWPEYQPKPGSIKLVHKKKRGLAIVLKAPASPPGWTGDWVQIWIPARNRKMLVKSLFLEAL